MIPAPTPPIAPPETTPAEADEKPSPTGRRQTVAFGPILPFFREVQQENERNENSIRRYVTNEIVKYILWLVPALGLKQFPRRLKWIREFP